MPEYPNIITASQLWIKESLNLVEQLQKEITWEKGKNKQLLTRLQEKTGPIDFIINHCGICNVYFPLEIITCQNCCSFPGTISFTKDELIQMINDIFQ
ncbi:MAG: hypothetical protein ACFFG0_18370 [Candidatus Thorarchaeota archaeon]